MLLKHCWNQLKSHSRSFHKIASVNLIGENKAAYVELKFSTDSIKLPLVWLRDHCQSESCYNWSTNQRKSKCLNVFEKAQVADKNSIKFNTEEQLLQIDWKDGHQSNYKTENLLRWAIQPTDSLPLNLWDKSTLRKIPTVSLDNFDFAKFCLHYAKNGVVQIENVNATPEATEEICRKIAPIQNTFFGDFWVFGTDETVLEGREDTAYGTEEIGPHTDGTYFNQTPGIQVFQCLRPADKGGDTLLVDGFAVAEKFRQTFPAYFHILSSTPIEHHYLEGINPDGTFTQQAKDNGTQLRSRAMYHPVIRLHQDRIIQIRFNPYDRAPLPMQHHNDVTETVAFYEAYQAFSQCIHNPDNAVQVSLKPGTVIFIDNYRVLHARTGFQGARKMCGCYLSRDDFLAKARTVLPEAFKHI